MSKSNKKNIDRLRDSCRKEKLRSDRHRIHQLIKEGRWDDIENLDEEIALKEEKSPD